MNKAVAFGISDNYWSLLLLQGEAYVGQEEWEPALAIYDEYLADNDDGGDGVHAARAGQGRAGRSCRGRGRLPSHT